MTTKTRKRIRISVPVSRELDIKLDAIAERLSVSKSSLCAMFISTAVVQKELELDIMSVTNINEIMKEQISKRGNNNE
jgi:predicted transcriptional regulator